MAVLLFGAWHGPALAQGSIEERLQRMEQRIRHLEERVAAQDRTIVEKDKQISKLRGLEEGWFNRVGVSGVVEIEAAQEKGYDGESVNGLDVATVDLVVAAEVNDWMGAETVLTYDGDGDKMTVDTATLTLAPPDTPVALIAGRHGFGGSTPVPFGVYETGMVSDPLTKDLGGASDDAVQLALDLDGVSASAFVFKGENDRGENDRIENFGFSAGYALERDEVSFALGLSWIDDIGESGGFRDATGEFMSASEYKAAVAEIREDTGIADRDKPAEIAALEGFRGASKVAGGGASLVAGFGGMTVIAEYVTAMSEFKPYEVAFRDKGAKPSAWMVEAGYGFELAGKPSSVAVGYQGTGQALALGLPESRFLVGFSVELLEAFSLNLEYARHRDYGRGDGGTGKSGNTATALLAAEF